MPHFHWYDRQTWLAQTAKDDEFHYFTRAQIAVAVMVQTVVYPQVQEYPVPVVAVPAVVPLVVSED